MRSLSALLLNLSAFFAVSILGFGFLLFLVSLLSFARLRNWRFLVTGIAFGLLAAKGALWTYRTAVLKTPDLLADVALDFAVLAFLYGAVAMRSGFRKTAKSPEATLTPATR